MKGLVLAAGLGTRLRPLTYEKPKPMLPIRGKPLLEYIIRLFKKSGIREILITIYYLSDAIVNYFGSGEEFGVKIKYFEEPELLGTGSALKKVEDFFEETFLVMNGDEVTDLDFSKLFDFHKRKNSVATICVRKGRGEEDLKRSGVLVLDEKNRVRDFVEKPGEEELKKLERRKIFASTGIYQFEPKIFDYIPDIKSFRISSLFPKLIQNNERVFGFPLKDALWFEIGSLERYKRAKNTYIKI